MQMLTDAGPLVWMVLLLGAVGLVGAARYAGTRVGRDASLAIGAAVASLAVAVLATVTGFQKSVGALGEVAAERRWIYLVGLQESLNNVVLAMIFVVLISLLLTAGAWRRAAS